MVVPAAPNPRPSADLIEKLKADTGAVAWGGGSAGGTDHILAGLIAKAAGADATKLNYVPFSGGGEALAAILGGHVTAGISGYGEWAGPDPVRRTAGAGDLRARAGRRHRHPDPQGAGRRRRTRQLARRGRRPRHRRCAEEGAARRGRRHASRARAGRRAQPTRSWMDLYLAGDEFAKYLAEENERVTRDPEDPGPGAVRSMLMERRAAAEIILGLGIAALGAFILYESQAHPRHPDLRQGRAARTYRSWSAQSWRCSASPSPGKAGARSRRRSSIRRR